MKKIISLLSAALIAVTCLFSLSACGGKSVNYTEDDLGKYIALSESDYKGFLSAPDFKAPTDAELNRAIMSLLYKNRDEDAQYNGANVLNVPITVGDTVYLYYRGYTVGEDGREQDIEGASNFSSSSLYALDIGSLTFIPGFEESLIGVNPDDYERFERKESGEVLAGDVIYLTYNALYPDGTANSKSSERIDLSDPNTDSRYGIGFCEHFTGAEIGKKMDSVTFEQASGSAVYYDIKVEFATSCERSPLTIEATFPEDYRESSLSGVNAKFDVYIRHIKVYNTPEYNDKFITDTLKITADELSAYEGESLTEKHRESLRYSLTEEAFWKYLAGRVTVKKLPESEVERVYEEYYYEATSLYTTYYSSVYSSLAEFAAAWYQVPDGMDWLDYIREKANGVITEKLMFYYIARAEGLLPEGETYDRLYAEVTEEYLAYYANDIYKEELDKLTDPAEKEKRLLEIKGEMLDYYGEEYFAEMVYYDHALPEIIALGKR